MLLLTFDDAVRFELSTVLIINLNDDQLIQASLPVRNGGLGIRSAQMLALSAFLASAASTRELQESILPHNIRLLEDKSVTENETGWLAMSEASKPVAELQHIQKAWDGLIVSNLVTKVLSRASSEVDKARLLAASTPHSGDWLLAPPISAVGLTLSDEAIRVSVVQRLGCRAYEPHTCLCGKTATAASAPRSNE